MTSWRDTASQQAQDDLDDLLNTALPLAIQMLGRSGEVFPYCATIAHDAPTAPATVDLGTVEGSSALEVLAFLRENAKENREGLRAAVYVSDVLVGGSDAIQFELEHSEGVALVVLASYSRSADNDDVQVGSLQVQKGELHAWKN